jgi:hypothetical protein
MVGGFGLDQSGVDRAANSLDGPVTMGEARAWPARGADARTDLHGTTPFDTAPSLTADTDDSGALWCALTGLDAAAFSGASMTMALDELFGSMVDTDALI